MKKILKKIFLFYLLVVIIVALWINFVIPKKQNVRFGVTFSPKFASEMGLDWKKAYLAMLDDLKVKDLRLVAYWDVIEPDQGKLVFTDLDWQIGEAAKSGAKVILVLGRKVPRWPECHVPGWIKSQDVNSETFDTALLNYIKETVWRYKNSDSIVAWQVENEPLFPFGTCVSTPRTLLNKEIGLVRSLDSRPIMLTDSGELGFAWPYLSVKADIFGTTLYRYVNNRFLGDIRYSLIPAYYFRIKAWWAEKILGKQIVISELQAEPWVQNLLSRIPLDTQAKTMNPQIFNEVTDYASRSGFPKAYLWGAEWWYWMKETQNKPEMWDAARKVIEQKQ